MLYTRGLFLQILFCEIRKVLGGILINSGTAKHTWNT